VSFISTNFVDGFSFADNSASNNIADKQESSISPNPALNSERMAVWVNGYPRSGSSTMLSMVTAAGDSPKIDSRNLSSTFSLFEPCHNGDKYTPWLTTKGCGTLLEGLTRCDFTGVQALWGWPDSHTTSNHSSFSPDVASRLCQQSHITAFKTVDQGHNISGWSWLLQYRPELRVIDIVRDPRGIYASWKTTEPFASIVGTKDFYSITDVCNTFKGNHDMNNPHVYHVVFEQLTLDPKGTMQEVYSFLGLPFGEAQEQWVSKTFNAQACPEPKPWEVGFTDCHQDSKASIEKWRTVLSDEEKAMFDSSEACQSVVKTYGFPES